MKKIILSLLALITATAFAQTEFTVMHGPGGVSDITTRYLVKELPNTYVAVNRAGAAGKIAITHLLADPDRSIMLATTVQVYVTNPLNFSDMNPYRDLDIITPIGVMPSALVCNVKSGFNSFKDFQNSKKQITLGVGGYGSAEHIATEVLIAKTGISATVIPYAQGGTTGVNDLLGGHIDCMFANFPTIRGHIAQPTLKTLITSHSLGLAVPTWQSVYKEQFPFQSYLAVVAPSKMSPGIKNKIKTDFQEASSNLKFNEGLKNLGLFPATDVDISVVLYQLEHTRRFILEKKLTTK